MERELVSTVEWAPVHSEKRHRYEWGPDPLRPDGTSQSAEVSRGTLSVSDVCRGHGQEPECRVSTGRTLVKGIGRVSV